MMYLAGTAATAAPDSYWDAVLLYCCACSKSTRHPVVLAAKQYSMNIGPKITHPHFVSWRAKQKRFERTLACCT